MLPWMRYESQATMHMDGAVRMLEHFNIRRRRNTSSRVSRPFSPLVFIDEMIDKPSNSITSPPKSSSTYVAIQEACMFCDVFLRIGFRKAPSLTIPEGAKIPKGSEFDVEQVIYTADGTWLRVSKQTMSTILKTKEGVMATGWVCAEPREMDPLCIPASSQLFVSLWDRDQALHNVRSSPSASEPSIAKIASGQMYIASEVVTREDEEWIRLHPQTLHTHRLPDKPCWLAVYLKNESHFLKRVETLGS